MARRDGTNLTLEQYYAALVADGVAAKDAAWLLDLEVATRVARRKLRRAAILREPTSTEVQRQLARM